jgi:hypothetical protein
MLSGRRGFVEVLLEHSAAVALDEERAAASQPSVVVPSVVVEDIDYIHVVSRLYNQLYCSLI